MYVTPNEYRDLSAVATPPATDFFNLGRVGAFYGSPVVVDEEKGIEQFMSASFECMQCGERVASHEELFMLPDRDHYYCEPCAWDVDPNFMARDSKCSECGGVLESEGERLLRMASWTGGSSPPRMCPRCKKLIELDEANALRVLLEMAEEL